MLGLLKAAFHLVKILDFILQAMGGALEPFKKERDLFRFVFQKHPSALATSSFWNLSLFCGALSLFSI